MGQAFQPHPPPPVIAIDTVPGDPCGGHASREGPSQPLSSQLRFGRQAPVLWNPHLPAAVASISPVFGPVEFAVQPDVAQRAGLGQEHPDLAVVDPDRPYRCICGRLRLTATFFEEADFIDDPDGCRLSQMLGHIGAPLVAHRVRLPQEAP